MKKYIAKIKKYINDVKNINTKEFLVTHKNALIVIVAIVLLGGIITAASYAYYQTLANQSIVGGQVGIVPNINMYVFVEDKNATTGAGLGTYSRSVYIPQYAYTYNSSLSYCKKGSTLTYNSTTHTFSISNNKDACYVYFDASVAANADIVLNLYVQKNGEYKMVNYLPRGAYELNTLLSSCTNGATMTTLYGRKVNVTASSKTECNAYATPIQLTPIYYQSSHFVTANYGSEASSQYTSTITNLTLNTDYFTSPQTLWNIYAKSEIDSNDRIITSSVCYKDNGREICLQGGDQGASYELNKELLLNSSLSTITCNESGKTIICSDINSGVSVIHMQSNGYVVIMNQNGACFASYDGTIGCKDIHNIVYRRNSTILAIKNTTAASSYPSSISGLTLGTDYYTSPNSSWPYYLKHYLDSNGNIDSTAVCFKDNGTERCIQGGDPGLYVYGIRETLMETSFSTITCTDNTTYVLCSGGGIYVYGDDTGKVQIDEYSGGNCNNTVPGVVVGSDGSSAYTNLYAASCWAGA